MGADGDGDLAGGTVKTYSWRMANVLAGVDSDDPDDEDPGYFYRGDLKRLPSDDDSGRTAARIA